MSRTIQEIDHLSQSSIRMYLACPKQWAALYLDGAPRRSGAALIKGSAVDHAADINWQQKRETGRDIEVEDAQELAEEMFRLKVDAAGGRESINWGADSLPNALDSALRMTKRHMLDHAPLYTPAITQQRVSVKLRSGRDFIGFIDAVAPDGTVIDVKSGSRRMSQKDADQDLQPGAYAFGLGRPVKFVYLRVIDSGRAPVHSEIVTTARSARGVEWFAELANDVSDAVDAGIFPANPGYSCGWCPIASACIAAITA